jgi:hypothetical protein
MAPLPSNSTGVLYLDYSVGGEGHTVQLRYNSGSSAVDAMGVLDEFLTALSTGIREITVEGARVRDAGASITLPITWTGEDHYGTGDAEHSGSAVYVDFIGRSAGGRRARLSMFGGAVIEDGVEFDYRLPATGVYGAARDVLDSAGDILCAIDEEAIVWYSYVNVGINAYWRNKIR